MADNNVWQLVDAAATRYNIDPALARAIVQQESGGQHYSNNRVLTSSAGALGIMQLMPGTARQLGVDPNDMAQNIDGGMRYLRQQLDAFGGNEELALAAYNAGPGAVQKYNGIPPFRETQNYVRNIQRMRGEQLGSGGGGSSQPPTDDPDFAYLLSLSAGGTAPPATSPANAPEAAPPAAPGAPLTVKVGGQAPVIDDPDFAYLISLDPKQGPTGLQRTGEVKPDASTHAHAAAQPPPTWNWNVDPAAAQRPISLQTPQVQAHPTMDVRQEEAAIAREQPRTAVLPEVLQTPVAQLEGGDLLMRIAAVGTAGAIKQYGEAAEAVGRMVGSDALMQRGANLARAASTLPPDMTGSSDLRREVYEVGTNTVQSVAAGVPGMAGGPIGFALNGGTIFGLAQANQSYKQAMAEGKTEDAVTIAFWDGLSEGGSEFASDLLAGKLAGVLGRAVGAPAYNSLLKAMGVVGAGTATEVTTEVLNSFAQNLVADKYGTSDFMPWEQWAATVPKLARQTAEQTLLMAGVGGAATALRQRQQAGQPTATAAAPPPTEQTETAQPDATAPPLASPTAAAQTNGVAAQPAETEVVAPPMQREAEQPRILEQGMGEPAPDTNVLRETYRQADTQLLRDILDLPELSIEERAIVQAELEGRGERVAQLPPAAAVPERGAMGEQYGQGQVPATPATEVAQPTPAEPVREAPVGSMADLGRALQTALARGEQRAAEQAEARDELTTAARDVARQAERREAAAQEARRNLLESIPMGKLTEFQSEQSEAGDAIRAEIARREAEGREWAAASPAQVRAYFESEIGKQRLMEALEGALQVESYREIIRNPALFSQNSYMQDQMGRQIEREGPSEDLILPYRESKFLKSNVNDVARWAGAHNVGTFDDVVRVIANAMRGKFPSRNAKNQWELLRDARSAINGDGEWSMDRYGNTLQTIPRSSLKEGDFVSKPKRDNPDELDIYRVEKTGPDATVLKDGVRETITGDTVEVVGVNPVRRTAEQMLKDADQRLRDRDIRLKDRREVRAQRRMQNRMRLGLPGKPDAAPGKKPRGGEGGFARIEAMPMVAAARAAGRAVNALRAGTGRAIDHVITMGRAAYAMGKQTFAQWRNQLRQWAGDVWDKVQPHLRTAWEDAKLFAMDEYGAATPEGGGGRQRMIEERRVAAREQRAKLLDAARQRQDGNLTRPEELLERAAIDAEQATGISNVNAAIVQDTIGREPISHGQKTSQAETMNDAMYKLGDNPYAGMELVAEINERPRPLSKEEDALLIVQQRKLMNDRSVNMRRMAEAIKQGDGEGVRLAEANIADIEYQLDTLHTAADRAGYENSLGMSFRRAMLAENYTLTNMRATWEALASGKALTEKQETELADWHKKLTEAQAEYFAQIEQGVLDLRIASTNQAVRDMVREVEADRKAGRTAPSAEAIAKKMAAASKEGAPDETIGRYINRIAKYFAEQGVRGRDELIDKVKDVIDRLAPDIYGDIPAEQHRSFIEDAFSGYGRFRPLSKGEVNEFLRDARGQLQQLAKLRDMEAGQAPRKTGQEQRKRSDEERRLVQQVNERKRRGGFIVSNPAQQLQSAMKAIETRLRNAIADAEFEINTGSRIVKDRTKVEDTPEITAMRQRLAALREQHEAIFGKRGLTDEQRVNNAIAATERSIADLKTRLLTGDIEARPTKPGPTSPQLEHLRAEREALQAELSELRSLLKPMRDPNEMANQRMQTYMARRAADMLDRIATNNFDPRPKREVVLTPATKLARQLYDDMRISYYAAKERHRIANLSPVSKMLHHIANGMGFMRSNIASFDLSFPFRQGVWFMHKPEFWRSFINMHRAITAENYKAMQAEIEQAPDFNAMVKDGLSLSDVGFRSRVFEEAFASPWANLQFGDGSPKFLRGRHVFPWVAVSNRAYTAMANNLRVGMYRRFVAQAESAGYTRSKNPDVFRAIAKYVNAGTGRGDLGGMEAAGDTWAKVFFSPRLVASRLELLAAPFGMYTGGKHFGLIEGPMFVRKQAMKDAYALIGTGLAFMTLAHAIATAVDDEDKFKVGANPFSTDFGKIKIGNTRIDIWGGFQQPVVLLNRLLWDSYATARGVTVDTQSGFGIPSKTQLIVNFLGSKTAPSVRMIGNILDKRMPWTKVMSDAAMPLNARSMVELYEENPYLLPLIIPSSYGFGINVHDKLPNKRLRSMGPRIPTLSPPKL